MQAGRFYLWVVVDPAWRQRGIGARLYDDALDFAISQGATLLDSDVREGHRESLHFAERRGFTIDRHMFESVIDLNTFDESRFEGLLESVAATGIRFFSLAEVGNTPEAQRKLYEVNRATSLDDPASHGTFPSFDEFSQYAFQALRFRPEGQILAADGDRYVGLAAVGYIEEDNSMVNMMTYVAHPRFKWLNETAAAMKIAPPNLAHQLKQVFLLNPEAGVAELHGLLEETITLAETHLPEVDLSRSREVIRHQRQVWQRAPETRRL